LKRSSVQSFALRAAGDPVSRGPMTSLKYWRFCITSERLNASSISAPAPVVSTVKSCPDAGPTERTAKAAAAART